MWDKSKLFSLNYHLLCGYHCSRASHLKQAEEFLTFGLLDSPSCPVPQLQNYSYKIHALCTQCQASSSKHAASLSRKTRRIHGSKSGALLAHSVRCFTMTCRPDLHHRTRQGVVPLIRELLIAKRKHPRLSTRRRRICVLDLGTEKNDAEYDQKPCTCRILSTRIKVHLQ